jgi:spore germination protein GerM
MKKTIMFTILSIYIMGLFAACSNPKASNTMVNKESIGTTVKEQSINLYFSDSNAEYLVGEERKIKEATPIKAIQELIEGPKSKELTRILPKELEVSEVSIKDGVAHVYIHESVPLAKHGNYGSSTATTFIINSVTATLILHEPFGIKKVKLEGDISDLLYGVDTNELFDVDMNLIYFGRQKHGKMGVQSYYLPEECWIIFKLGMGQ